MIQKRHSKNFNTFFCTFFKNVEISAKKRSKYGFDLPIVSSDTSVVVSHEFWAKVSLHRIKKNVYRNLCRFIEGIAELEMVFIASSVRRKQISIFLSLYREKKFGFEIIVSLYSIFSSELVYRCRFNRYIFEYRCPPLPITSYTLMDHELAPMAMDH